MTTEETKEAIIQSHLSQVAHENLNDIRSLVDKLIGISNLVNAQMFVREAQFRDRNTSPMFPVNKQIHMNTELKMFLSDAELFLNKYPSQGEGM